MSRFKNNVFPLVKFFIGWPLSIISLIFIFKVIFSNSVNSIFQIKHFDPFLFFVSVFCFLIYFSLRAITWKRIIREKGIEISHKENAYFFSISELKRYTPGNIWSFLSRSFLFEQRGLSKKDSAFSLLTEAEYIVLGSLIISIPAIFLFLNDKYLNAGLFIAVTILILFFIFNKSFILSGKIASFLPRFSPMTNIEILLLSFFSFIFFSFGSYFATISIINLDLYFIVQHISIFALALLVGYLSIITPMGLGVREGVTIFGLSKFIPVSLAGLSAIFSRLVFMLSEVIFILFVFLWNKIINQKIQKFEGYLAEHKYELILIFAVLVYIFYFTNASFLRYDNFFTGRFDLGNMDQAVWNTRHGRIFQITDPNGTNIISRLAFHADFILILISPLYFIWSNPKVLLLLQTVILAIGALFVYLLSKNVLKNKNISLVFSLAYLLNPALGYSNLYDFHPVTLATTFLLAASYFFVKRRYIYFVVFAMLAGLTKEEVWAIISIFGLYLALSSVLKIIRKDFENRFKVFIRLLFGVLLFLSCLAIFYYLIWYAIPQARGGNHFALSYYSDFGYSPSSIIKNIIFSPVKTLSIIFSKSQLIYLFQIFFPLGFLSFFAPIALIFAGPDFVINLLSNNGQLHEIYYQYTATITPFIFISGIYGVSRLRRIFCKIPLGFYSLIVIVPTLISAYSWGPLPGTARPNIDMFTETLQNRDVISNFLADIPPRYSIAATNNLGSHLSRRQKIYTIPVGIDKADIIAFLLNDDFAQPSLPSQIKMANEMEADKKYIEIFKQDTFVVFEKKNLYLNSLPRRNQVNLFPFSLPSLEHREYKGSNISIESKVSSPKSFNAYIVSYQSDGLKLYALMDVPNTKKPEDGFPVVIVNHGYIDPKQYSTVNSYRGESDYFAQRGYLVLKPDYRGNGKSELEDAPLMRFAYPVDVMNLLASLDSLPIADENNVYMWGHSMGGEVTLKVLEILGKQPEFTPRVKAAALWAPVIDPIRWFSANHLPELGESKTMKEPYKPTFKIMGTPESNPVLWQGVSQLVYLPDINTPIQINQGTNDGTVPFQYSIELYDDLISLNKNASLITYPNDNHNLLGSFNKALQNNLTFFKSH